MPDTLGSGMLSMIAMGRAGSPPPVVALATGSDLPWLLVLLAVGALVYRVIQSNLERQRNESINDRLRRLGAGHALAADMKLRWNPILLALAGLACAWFGCLSMADSEPGIGILMLLVGAWLAWAAWDNARRKAGPPLRMDRHGLHSSEFGLIPWSEVVGIDFQRVEKGNACLHQLGLCVRDPGRYLRDAPPRVRRRHASLEGARTGCLWLQLDMLDKHPDLIHRAALQLRRRDPGPFLKEWTREMDDSVVEAFLEARVADQGMRGLHGTRGAQGSHGHRHGQLRAGPAPMDGVQDRAEQRFRRAMAAHERRAARKKKDERFVGGITFALVLLYALWRLLG